MCEIFRSAQILQLLGSYPCPKYYATVEETDSQYTQGHCNTELIMMVKICKMQISGQLILNNYMQGILTEWEGSVRWASLY